MKQLGMMMVVLATLLLSGAMASAQTPDEKNFIGTWELTISGMPNGNMEIPLTVSYEDDTLKGNITTPDGTEMNFDSIAAEDGVLMAEFEAEGFTVNLELSLEEDGTLSGYMMNAFSVKGKKVVVEKE